MSPIASININNGELTVIPATKSVFPVLATKYVSAILYTILIIILNTTGNAS